MSHPTEGLVPETTTTTQAPASVVAAPAKKTGRPALDPSGSLALHFRIPGNAGAALTRAAGSAPGARSVLARRLLLAAMAQAGLIFTSDKEGQIGLVSPMPTVTDATTTLNHADHVANYVSTQIRGNGAVIVKVSAAQLYQHYRGWCQSKGINAPVTKTTFGKRLATLGGWRTFTAAIPGTGKTEAVRIIPHVEVGVPYVQPA